MKKRVKASIYGLILGFFGIALDFVISSKAHSGGRIEYPIENAFYFNWVYKVNSFYFRLFKEFYNIFFYLTVILFSLLVFYLTFVIIKKLLSGTSNETENKSMKIAFILIIMIYFLIFLINFIAINKFDNPKYCFKEEIYEDVSPGLESCLLSRLEWNKEKYSIENLKEICSKISDKPFANLPQIHIPQKNLAEDYNFTQKDFCYWFFAKYLFYLKEYQGGYGEENFLEIQKKICSNLKSEVKINACINNLKL